MTLRQLPLRNVTRKPGRTAALMLLTAFLALSVFFGSVVVLSLRSGLNSLEARLGADIIVMPAEAESKVSFKNLLLQGTTGAFYMDASSLQRVEEVEGVAVAAPQTFLASLKADCCAVKVQVIGIDPERDFTVMPWIQERYRSELQPMDVVVGCKVNAGVGEDLRIYDLNTHVVAQLAETGTGFDTAVYCTMDTMRTLLKAAEAKGVSHKITSDTDDMISAVYVRVQEGCDVGKVCNALNGHVRKATAVRAKSMFTGVSDSLNGIAHTVTLLIGAVWVLAVAILLIAYAMMINERGREFAVLRMLGASRRGMGGLMLKEAALISLMGGCAGVLLAAIVVFPFTTLIETRLGLPYLTPDWSTIGLLVIATIGLTLAIGALSSAWAAYRLSRTDPGTMLREGT